MPCMNAKEVFDHVLNVVFQVPKDRPLYKALLKSGDTNVWDTISLNQADIDSLTYDRSETEKNVSLSRQDKILLHIFNHYTPPLQFNRFPNLRWLAVLTPEDFDRYQVGPDYIAIKYLGATAPKPPATTVQSPQPAQTPVDTFKKHSIKHDPSLFIVFNNSTQFDSW